MGFTAMGQDKCVYKCTPIEGQPPIYVGLYVDDLIYYSPSDAVEEWFENNLKSHLKVDFMGDVHGSLVKDTYGIMMNMERFPVIFHNKP